MKITFYLIWVFWHRHSKSRSPTRMLGFDTFSLLIHCKRKMETLLISSSIYETFQPFNIVLCCCGFWFSGKHNASLKSIKSFLSVLYSLYYFTFFVLKAIWGEQEPKMVDSFLMKHGRHYLFLSELLFLPIIIWSNFYNRQRINECLQLIDRYDTVCQVILLCTLSC